MKTEARNLLKTFAFTLVVPATVAVLVPYAFLSPATVHEPFSATPQEIGAILLGVFGLTLYARCALGFALEGRGTPAPIDPPKELVLRGPYRWTRNPMYVAVLSVVSAEALYFASVKLLAYVVLLFLGFHLFVVLYEEPTLTRKFGEAYTRYCGEVPRWLSYPYRRYR